MWTSVSPPDTPLEQAQVLIYQAHKERLPKRRAALARRALEISPDCADAYDLLSTLEPDTPKRLALTDLDPGNTLKIRHRALDSQGKIAP